MGTTADRNLAPTVDGKPRSSASFRIDTALLAQARELGINPAESLETELKRRIKAARRGRGGVGFG